MMKDVKEIIVQIREYLEADGNEYYGYEMSRREARVALSVLEKSIPTTPIYVVDDEPLCPYCREPIEYSDCDCDCGQKIDWR